MTTLVRWDPFRELDLFDRVRGFGPSLMRIPALPATDIYERDDEYVVEIEVPGYEEKELTIEVLDHTLTVKGAHETESDKAEKTYRLQERLSAGVRAPLRAPTDGRHREGHRDLQGRRPRAACKKGRGRHAEADPRRDVSARVPRPGRGQHPAAPSTS